MILILKKNATEAQIEQLITKMKAIGLETHLSQGQSTTIVGLVGDTTSIDIQNIMLEEVVDTAKRIQEPYKQVNRKFHQDDTVVCVGNHKIGSGNFQIIAGPCSVEGEEQILQIAKGVKAAGANLLRGGAFKPRTSPYAFQGLKGEGIELLKKAKAFTAQPIVSEIMNINHLDLFADVDIIQVGARNMQNFDLLKELGMCNKPILLKRGMSSTIEELLMSAEYIMAGGNKNVILCERGIRTFERATRNTLDISAIPVLKRLTHLPVVIDPSHAAGLNWMVEPLSKAAIAAGADGLIIEVHNDPKNALCDGAQSLTIEEFSVLMKVLKKYIDIEGKIMN